MSDKKLFEAIEAAHTALWTKFVGEEGLIHDFVGEIPTPDDCRLGRPNAIGVYKDFDNHGTKVFGHAKWREGYPDWFPQKTQADAERVAYSGDKEKLGLRKSYECRLMRNPLAAAAIIAMAGYQDGRAVVRQAIAHYDYAKLNMAEFFFAECAYYAPVSTARYRVTSCFC